MQSNTNVLEIDKEQDALTHYIDCLLDVDRVAVVLKNLAQPPAPPAEDAPPVADGIAAVVFYAGGLKFAVKLEHLAGVQVLADELVAVKAAPAWVSGRLGVGKKATVVIDPSLLAEPNRRATQSETATPLGKHLVTVNGGRLAFLCDEVEKVQSLEARKIKWNKKPEQRPWLNGVIMSDALAILDTDQIEAMLKS